MVPFWGFKSRQPQANVSTLLQFAFCASEISLCVQGQFGGLLCRQYFYSLLILEDLNQSMSGTATAD